MLGETFQLTKEHIDLLTNAVVSWYDCEFGAPCIDPKRPYGNSDVLSDLAKILGFERKVCPHCGEPIEEDDNDLPVSELEQTHRETEIALQIVLDTQSFKPGLYLRYNDKWELSKLVDKKIEKDNK